MVGGRLRRVHLLLLPLLGLFVFAETADRNAIEPVRVVFVDAQKNSNGRAVAAAGRMNSSRGRNKNAAIRNRRAWKRARQTNGWEESSEDDVYEKGDRECDDFEHGDGYDEYDVDGNATFLNPCHGEPSSGFVATDDASGNSSNASGYPSPTGGSSFNGSRPFNQSHSGDNHVMVAVFVALRPNEASRGALVTQILSLYMNASTHLWVDLREQYWNHGGGQGGQEPLSDEEQQVYNPDDDEQTSEGMVEPANATYVVQHHHTNSALERKGNWWWWEYEIWYDCFTLDTNPVLEWEALHDIESTMQQSLQSGMETGDLYAWMMTTYNGTFGALDLTTIEADIFSSDAVAIPDNSSQVFLTLYIALRPGDPSRRTLITEFLSEFLSETNSRFRIVIKGDPDYATEELEEKIEDDYVARRQLGSDQEVGENWTMIHRVTYSDTVNKRRRLWWWEFNVVYECFHGDSDDPVTDLASLEAISTTMKQTIQDGIDSGSIFQWLRDHYSGGLIGIVNMTTDSSFFGGIDRPSDSGSSSGSESSSSSDSADPTQAIDPDKLAQYLTPVNPYEWNWLRYLGLAIFVGTVLVTFVLMHLAAYRHRALANQELWGNLGTVKGVEEVLQTGWTIKGCSMEIYDKSKLGYDDEQGSMLIGGFEQRVVLGAEITVERFHGSEATPETHRYSFTHGTVSEYPSEHLRLPDTPPLRPKTEEPEVEVKASTSKE